MRRIAYLLALILGAGALVACGGCADWFPGDVRTGEWNPRGGPVPMEPPAPAGLPTSDVGSASVEATSGRVLVSGRLLYIDDGEGLFWAIADDDADPLSSGIPPLVAVIANPTQAQLDRFVGLFVRAEGVRSKDAERVEDVMMLDVETVAPIER